MSKLTYSLFIVLLVPLLLIAPAEGSAAGEQTINLDNYYAARTSAAGEHYLMDKYYNPDLKGDATENDATIQGFKFVATGLQSGDKVHVDFDDGTTREVAMGQLIAVSNNAKKMNARLVKVSSGETYVKMTVFRVYDDTASGNVTYNLTADLTAETEPPLTDRLAATHYYAPFKDEYRVDYKPPAGSSSYELYYEAPNGTAYNAVYNKAPTGIHWLTCNGTYWLKFYDSSGNLFTQTDAMVTNQIQYPSCDSYLEGNAGSNDLNLTVTANKDDSETGRKRVNADWQKVEGAVNYEIWVDGVKLLDTDLIGATIYTEGDSLTVIAKDQNGNTVGQSDALIPDVDGGGGEPPTNENGCDACKWLTDMLACPAWDDYMGDLTQAIKNALPPPPNWSEVADIFVDKFADYFGDVPAPPSIPEIENNIRPDVPGLNTSVPEANIAPSVPSDFNNGPLNTDISSGPQIEVEDGSKPIEIYEPDKFIKSDDAGEFVYPNDNRNSSEGIKQPETIETDYKNPVPSKPSDNTTPPAEVPIPSGSTSTTPIPNGTDLIIPIPKREGE